MTASPSTSTASPARTLRRLYLARFGFALVWALLLALVAPLSDPVLTALLVLYPLVDAVSVLVELRASEPSERSRLSEIANVVLSALAAIALGWASSVSGAAALAVWGAWAILSGATQLLASLGRRGPGRWPLVVSGGLSLPVGALFLLQGLQGGASVGGIAGYAVAGGVFFLVAALRLARPTRSP